MGTRGTKVPPKRFRILFLFSLSHLDMTASAGTEHAGSGIYGFIFRHNVPLLG